MRFIHTADWHLGRIFHGTQLCEDQHAVLQQLAQLAREEKPDAVLIAGDVYDRAVPPPEAVELLDEILTRLVIEQKTAVVLIAGNHDSPNRLSFGRRLLAGQQLFVHGAVVNPCQPILLCDKHGPVSIYAFPFAEPSAIRECLGRTDLPDHESAMRAMAQHIRQGHPAGQRSVLVAHAFVQGGMASESERPLSVGGAGCVQADCFDGFDYVALGHLHAPQKVRGESIRYSGSLLKYSFDEADQAKGVTLVEMDGEGRCTSKSIGLRGPRDVRRIEGTMANLLKGPNDNGGREDYLEVTLLDDGPVIDPIGRLREVYPNVLQIRRPERKVEAADEARPDVNALGEKELFKAFFSHVTGGEELTAEQESAFARIVDGMRQREREQP